MNRVELTGLIETDFSLIESEDCILFDSALLLTHPSTDLGNGDIQTARPHIHDKRIGKTSAIHSRGELRDQYLGIQALYMHVDGHDFVFYQPGNYNPNLHALEVNSGDEADPLLISIAHDTVEEEFNFATTAGAMRAMLTRRGC